MRLRARQPEHKEERRLAIVAAGRALLADASLAEVTMAAVAERAGLAKGTLFLYFPTKEALCLAVLSDELARWLDALDAELDRPGRFTPQRLVRAVVASVAERALLVRLLAVLSTVVERNVDLDTVVAFKTALLGRLAASGAVLERRLGLEPGEGLRLLLRMNAVVVGLYQATDLSPVVREALARPELAPLRVDFAAELPVLLAALLRGLHPHRV